MNDHMMEGMQPGMMFMWTAVAIVTTIVIALFVFFARRAPTDNLLPADMAAGGGFSLASPVAEADIRRDDVSALAHDTIFILPDISHYTRFMTGNRFAFAHAQYIIFSLINTMIEAATKTVQLSKLEGDAALFFVNTDTHSDVVIGRTVLDIFVAFFKERRRLKETNICPCSACTQIDGLDLKIFVHRGRAARFSFRGSVDHFGTDVIILHRMMKNGVPGHRYVMVTEAAEGCISLSGQFEVSQIEEDIEHIGNVGASIFTIDDAMVSEFLHSESPQTLSAATETYRKLRENVRILKTALGRVR